MNRAQMRAGRAEASRNAKAYPKALTPVPRDEWPRSTGSMTPPLEAFRSRDFLVQVFAPQLHEASTVEVRLTVCRTTVKGGTWADGISWDDLQRIKSEIGYGDRDAVEVYPADRDVVNVAAMRHLWVLRSPLTFAWRQPDCYFMEQGALARAAAQAQEA